MSKLSLQAVNCFAIGAQLFMALPLFAQPTDVWIGTGGKPSLGIYHCRLDLDSGRLSASRLVAPMSAPGFLAMHPTQPLLYAVGGLDGRPVVAGFRIQAGDDAPVLQLINAREIGDGGATHLSVSPDGRMLVTAQYGGGSVAAFALAEDGSIADRTVLIKHQGGSGVVPGRQTAPHAHWAGFSPDQRFVLVPDLGLDQVLIYRADTARATLHEHGSGTLPPGAGPRHLKFHPNGQWLYVLNELDLTISLFDWDAAAGSMSLRQTVPTVPLAELQPLQQKSCSEIRIHPRGHVVYAANRGHDSITVLAVGEDGRLTSVQNMPVRGATPRNFNLDPTARWLLAAGQDSHTLASFAIEPESGWLRYNHSIISTPSPICVLMQFE